MFPLRPMPSLFFFLMIRRPPRSPLFPYTTPFRSDRARPRAHGPEDEPRAGRLACEDGRGPRDLVGPLGEAVLGEDVRRTAKRPRRVRPRRAGRSEEHTSELQSLAYLVCRLLLAKK